MSHEEAKTKEQQIQGLRQKIADLDAQRQAQLADQAYRGRRPNDREILTNQYEGDRKKLQAEIDVLSGEHQMLLADLDAKLAREESAVLRETNRRLVMAAEESATSATKAASVVEHQGIQQWVAIGISIFFSLLALFTKGCH